MTWLLSLPERPDGASTGAAMEEWLKDHLPCLQHQKEAVFRSEGLIG